MTVWMIDEVMKHMNHIWVWGRMNDAINVNDELNGIADNLVRPWVGNPRTTGPYPGPKRTQAYEEMSPFPCANRQYHQVSYPTGPPERTR